MHRIFFRPACYVMVLSFNPNDHVTIPEAKTFTLELQQWLIDFICNYFNNPLIVVATSLSKNAKKNLCLQLLLYAHLLFSLSYIITNGVFFWFGLLIGQNKTPGDINKEHVIGIFHNLLTFLTVSKEYGLQINWLWKLWLETAGKKGASRFLNQVMHSHLQKTCEQCRFLLTLPSCR